jgi:charged multivesicular body protein 3
MSSGLFRSFFGRQKTPEEQLKEWKSKLRAQSKEIDREIRGIETQEGKIRQEIKALAKKPALSQKAIRSLATELVRSQKAKDHLLTGKTHINSVIMQMQEQVSMVKVSGCIQKSTNVMRSMNGLMKLPQMRDAMYEMSKEMTKAGLIEEMINDTMSEMDEEDETLVDSEVDAIVNQIADGKILQVLSAPKVAPKKSSPSLTAPESVKSSTEDEDTQLNAMQARLQALK